MHMKEAHGKAQESIYRQRFVVPKYFWNLVLPFLSHTSVHLPRGWLHVVFWKGICVLCLLERHLSVPL